MNKRIILSLLIFSIFLFSCKVNVKENEAPFLSELIITSDISSIKEGDIFNINLKAKDNRNINKIFWNIDNKDILREEKVSSTVNSSNIQVKALKSGKVKITATEKDTDKTVSAVYVINENKQSDIEEEIKYTDTAQWPLEKNETLSHVRERIPKDESVRENFTEDTIKRISNYVAYSSDALADKFPRAFGYLKNAELGMGLKGGPYGSGTSMATTGIGPRMDKINFYGEVLVPIEYNITIYLHNFERYTKDNKGNHQEGDLTAKGINQLKEVIPHEMMHAMMGETLTSGMVNRHIDSFTYTDGLFPTWFIEGTATTIGGTGGQSGRLSTHQIKDFESAQRALRVYSISEHPPKYDTETWYGTGYLAVMYLGYSIGSYMNLDNSITNENIRKGLDLLLESMEKGYSMVDSINRLSGTNYKTVKDFEIYFTNNGAQFCLDLVNAIGDGIGSLLNENLSDKEFAFLNENYVGSPVFKLNPDSTDVSNFYNIDTAVIKGGGREVTGYDRFGGYPADALPPEGYKKGDNPLPLSKPDGFNPYKKISNITLKVDIPSPVVGSAFPKRVSSDILGDKLYKDFPLYEVGDIKWIDSTTNKEVLDFAESGKTYIATVVFTAKGYIKEDEQNLYGTNARFLDNNNFIINGENISLLYSKSGTKIEITPYGTKVIITKPFNMKS